MDIQALVLMSCHVATTSGHVKAFPSHEILRNVLSVKEREKERKRGFASLMQGF